MLLFTVDETKKLYESRKNLDHLIGEKLLVMYLHLHSIDNYRKISIQKLLLQVRFNNSKVILGAK